MQALRETKSVSRCNGYTMLEVLIAVLVLSIGLLGLAGLQSTSQRTNHSAYLRSQATLMAYDIADRMRANRPVATGGGYNINLVDGPPGGGSAVAVDLTDWLNNLRNVFPDGDGSITQVGGNFRVTVQWDDSRGIDAPQQFVMEFQL